MNVAYQGFAYEFTKYARYLPGTPLFGQAVVQNVFSGLWCRGQPSNFAGNLFFDCVAPPVPWSLVIGKEWLEPDRT